MTTRCQGALDGVIAASVAETLVTCNFEGLKCRELLHASRAEYHDGFADLNLGLQALGRERSDAGDAFRHLSVGVRRMTVRSGNARSLRQQP
jgi:hypothetical protein